jgi:hypothetical protein
MSFMHLLNWLSQLIFEFMVEPNSGERDDNIILFYFIDDWNREHAKPREALLVFNLPCRKHLFSDALPVPYRPITSPVLRAHLPSFCMLSCFQIEIILKSSVESFFKKESTFTY